MCLYSSRASIILPRHFPQAVEHPVWALSSSNVSALPLLTSSSIWTSLTPLHSQMILAVPFLYGLSRWLRSR